jgi:hypothetical protein
LIAYIYVFLGLVILGVELCRRVARAPIDALTFFNCYYFVLFVFVPINVIYLGPDVVRQEHTYEKFGYGDDWTAWSLLISYLVFVLGYGIASATRGHAQIGPQYDLSQSALIGKLILVLGLTTTAIYISQIGDPFDVILRARDVRSGELIIDSRFVFYRHLSQFSADAVAVLFAVLLGKRAANVKITKADYALFGIAVTFFAYYALSTGGRRAFIYPLLVAYLVYISTRGVRIALSLTLLGLLFALAGLGMMFASLGTGEDPWGFAVSASSSSPVEHWLFVLHFAYKNTIQGLADSFIHFVGAQRAEVWQFGFLRDIAHLPFDFFPSQILGFERSRHVFGETTEYFLGYPLADGMSGEEPLGLHGYLLVNFGYVGFLAIFFLLGVFYERIHTAITPGDRTDSIGWLVYWWIALMFFAYFREGMVLFVVKQHLTWWITVALLLTVARRPNRARAIGAA